jgi:serine/threonine protein kinase
LPDKKLFYKGIFIGDIKPSNILLDKNKRATITDFETAMLTDDVADQRIDTYNLFASVLSRLFNSEDGKPYTFVRELLSKYNNGSCPLLETILMEWDAQMY